jgi:hypothetical protein
MLHFLCVLGVYICPALALSAVRSTMKAHRRMVKVS